MTNKAELLRLLRLAWGAEHVTAEDCKKIDAIIAAPPEDVRAVVDEPAAWRCGGITWSYRADAMNHAERFSLHVEPLYRHPQRQMVLPERKEPTQDEPYMTEASHGFNACLDEISRLNK
jgi:hypothetical protein